ncbi:3-hydroxyacyl-[acyl-carrier-protein] dehydratase [Dyadobacter jejuensis]|uniref:3-hydroxyacyl-[acyl-carrier-protein] dehydratase n=1 Tax=Dyadobacter jejuensis TaxID=1082580 RepID=A0A316AM98_9BACT|nr:3-hydroxyacyl-ACP dehydratase [Dyadobacter jejuensis]PWJ58568.1 3-hydroxyacyl-[acyl-carrier-protein] dehydratase [Dyadobacter jejuensis]
MNTLLNHLYSIENLAGTDTSLTASIRLNADHAVYLGHFPGNPITPGVVQMDFVKEALQQQLGRKLRMKSMKTCKFLQIVNPTETPVLNLEINFNDGEFLEVSAAGVYGETVYFKMQSSYV